jgi:chemotaxis-related protein WspB
MLFVLMQLGNDRYALESSTVAEVLPLLSVRPVPGAPIGIAGLIDWRGAPTPVVDLSELVLGRPSRACLSTRIIILRFADASGETRMLGLIAEKATETVRREPTDFLDVGIRSEVSSYLGPVAFDGHGMVQWIDPRKLMPTAVRDALFRTPDESQWPSETSRKS